MAVTAAPYGALAVALADARVDWDTDAFRVSLHTSVYVPNVDTHDFFDDATNELTTAGGYTAGGVLLTGKTRTLDGATNTVKLDADDVTWTALDPSAAFRYAVIRKARGGVASADELVGYVDFGADQDPNGVDFTIAWHADGAVKITY